MKKLFENALGRRLMFGLAGICAVIVALFLCDYDVMVLTMATISSVVLFFRLPYACLPVKNAWTRLGWGCYEFSTILLLCSLLSLYSFCGVKFYGLALLSYMLIGMFAYAYFIPWFTEKFDLDKNTRANKFFNHNGILGYLILWAFFLAVETYAYEIACHNSLQNTEDNFVPVKSWIVIDSGNGKKYILDTPQGRFSILASEYPEIVDINENTEIKGLLGGYYCNGAMHYNGLEIKN